MGGDTGGFVLESVVGFRAQLGKTFFKMRREFFVTGLSVEVVGLIGVGLEIVELELLRRNEVMDELVALCADTAQGERFRNRDIRSTRRASLCAMWVRISLPQAATCSCLACRRVRQAGNVEQGWRHVEVQNHLFGVCAGLDAARIAQSHGHADGGLIHQAACRRGGARPGKIRGQN